MEQNITIARVNQRSAKNYKRDIYFSKLLVERLFNILQAFCEGYLLVPDEKLNAAYILVLDGLRDSLRSEDLTNIIVIPDDIPKNLFEIDGTDLWWDEGGGRAKLIRLIGDISSTWVRAGSTVLTPDRDLVNAFSEIDEIIDEYRKEKADHSKKFLVTAEAKAKQLKEGLREASRKEKVDHPNEIILDLKAGKLTLNKSTGFMRLNRTEKYFSPERKEFQILVKLAEAHDHQATYQELLGHEPSKTSKMALSHNIKNIKKALGILGKGKSQNKNIIDNQKNYGYRLVT